MNIIQEFDSTVLGYVLSLSAERREELSALFINSHASWPWYAEVIDRYGLRDPTSRIVADIAQLFPDEAALSLVESDFSGPVFEAGIILREAKKLILNSSSILCSNEPQQ